jgi:uncharacterized repeat protein (TIGR03847 family)
MGFYYDFENADAFATGAIGTPGERTFYMQVRADGRTVSVKCEKQQVAALAQYLRNMLADMPDTTGSVNNSTATLQNPVEQDFVLGSVGLGVDRSNMRMVVQLEEMILVDEDDDDVFVWPDQMWGICLETSPPCRRFDLLGRVRTQST